MPPPKPTPADLLAAAHRVLPDVIGPGLSVLFCGINPGLYSAATGHPFARPGNRFWPALHRGGFTPRLLAPSEQDQLPAMGIGITNLVARASAAAAELSPAELVAGAALLLDKAERYRPAVVAFLGVTAYRAALGRPTAAIGRQPEPFGSAVAWVLPNPSGLNAHYRPTELAQLFGELFDGLRGRGEEEPR
jgi:TDG/mug DNA glycosylase family protein